MEHLDSPVAVRDGEGLDAKVLAAFLLDAIPDLSEKIEIRQFPSGFSNLTYLIKAGDREMVLRKPPHGKKAKTAHDMGREYRILKALKPIFPYVPEPVLYCEDRSVLGSPFYVMERIKGVIIRKNFPKTLHFSEGEAKALCENWLDALCQLHALDYEKAGLGDFGKPLGYVQRQVEGWSRRYRDARTPDAPDYEGVMQWLHDNLPPESEKPAVIHNDYKFDNVILDPDDPLKIIGILDWEMATIGDPLMDLGASLGYWVNHDDPEELKMIRTLPTTVPGMLTRDELVRLYAEKSGRRIDNFDFYLCFGLFKLAGIAQQIYYRFYHGQTKDQRFQMLIFAVQILEKAATTIVARYG